MLGEVFIDVGLAAKSANEISRVEAAFDFLVHHSWFLRRANLSHPRVFLHLSAKL